MIPIGRCITIYANLENEKFLFDVFLEIRKRNDVKLKQKRKKGNQKQKMDKRLIKNMFYMILGIILMAGAYLSNGLDGIFEPENKTVSETISYISNDNVKREENPVLDVVTLSNLPDYDSYGKASIELNGNVPNFTDQDIKKGQESFETYSDLDSLGRCGVAYANISVDIMPSEKRGNIGMVKPAGWHTIRYDDLIEEKYLYNRCHLIAFMLAGENANKKNLITGTRYLNVDGMLPYEKMVYDYVKKTRNHVLYRVTPIYDGDNLIASGVEMEAMSVEDNGKGIMFHVYCYNVQPKIVIDYKTGDSHPA